MSLALLFMYLAELDDFPRPKQIAILDRLTFSFIIRKGTVPAWIKNLQKLAYLAPPDFKFNPYHDNLGRFTFGPSVTQVSDRTCHHG